MYKCAPEYLQRMLQPKESLNSLRISNDKFLLNVPNLDKANYKNRRFSICAPRIWNSLPIEIRSASTLKLFMSKLKTYYFTDAYSHIF